MCCAVASEYTWTVPGTPYRAAVHDSRTSAGRFQSAAADEDIQTNDGVTHRIRRQLVTLRHVILKSVCRLVESVSALTRE